MMPRRAVLLRLRRLVPAFLVFASLLFFSRPTGAQTVVGLWRFDEGSGTNVADSSGLGNNGTLQSDDGILPTWTPGMTGFGSALLFTNDGATHDYVNIPASASLQIGQTASDPWTITAWAYEESNSVSDYVASYGRVLVIDDGEALQLESGASGDDEFYTWARANTEWQVAWGSVSSSVTPLLGQWEHWAQVYDGTNLTLYLNGNEANGGAASTPITAAIGYAGYQGGIHIGSELGQTGDRNWAGMLDDVAVFNGALTQDQVQKVMSGDFSGFMGGPPQIISQPQKQTIPPGGTATFTVGAAGLQPLLYQWYRNNVKVPNATNATLVLADAQPTQAGYYTASVSNTLGAQISSPAQLLVYNAGATLVGLWRFNEGSGTNVTDSSGLGNDGTLRTDGTALPQWVPSQSGFGDALSFINDGATHDYVDIPGNNSLMIGQTSSNAWSITAWAYESSDGTGDFVSAYGRIAVIDDGNALQMESGAPGDDEFYTWARENLQWQIGWGNFPQVTPLLDQWVHWAQVYDGTNLYLYRDGNLGTNGGVASMPVTAPLGYPGYEGGFHIGTEVGQPGDRNWNGMIDDVAVFKVALTQSQVQTVMSGDFSSFLLTSPSRPELSIAVSGGNAVLSWAAAAGAFQLQSSANLAQWSAVTAAAVTNGATISVTTPLGAGAQFFRLTGQ